MPDILIHTPGDMAGNHAIIEVKSVEARRGGIRKDLETMARFRRVAGYERAIYLIFGGRDLETVYRTVEEFRPLPEIELWVHPQPGEPADKIATLGVQSQRFAP